MTKPYDDFLDKQDYIIRPAFWTRGCVVIRIPEGDSRAGRVSKLLANNRYSQHQRGYVMTITKAGKFINLYATGWDADDNGNLISPKPINNQQEF